MATINFIVKGKKNFSNILVRFKNGRAFDITASTGLKVDPNQWNSKKQQMRLIAGNKKKDQVNRNLRLLKDFLIDEFNIDHTQGEIVDKGWLEAKINSFFNRTVDDDRKKVYFREYLANYIEEAKTRPIKGKNKPVSKGTITKYRTTLNKIVAFEEAYGKKLKFKDLNLDFYNEFVAFLSKEQRINYNTIGNYIGTIKTVARDAKLKGLPVHPHIEHPKFFAPKLQSTSIYLTDEEIQKICNYDFSFSEGMDNARDLFIIGLRTGLRVSDFLRLGKENIKNGFFEVVTVKTGKRVIIPIHPNVEAIMKKHKGIPRRISDQKFNRYIKKICKEVGIDSPTHGSKLNPETKRKEPGTYPKYELVTSHICRRSFATNLYGSLPNNVIMAITGHKTETQFLNYIKTTPKENAEMLKKFWEEN